MIKNKKIFRILVITGFLINGCLYAQDTEDNRDLESWSTLAIKYKPTKKISLGLEEQIRFNNNASEVDQYFTQLEGRYEILKDIYLGAELRYIRENDNQGKVQGYENHFRYQLNLAYKHEIERFTLKYKLGYQNKNELNVSIDEGDVAKETIRFKTSLGYNIRKWPLDPSIDGEVFNNIGDTDEPGFSKYRFTIGTDYKIKKVGEISLFYRFEKELNVDAPASSDILGLKFTYTIK